MTDLEGWRAACDRLVALAERVTRPPFPVDGPERAQAVHHLVQQLVCWLEWEVLHADPARPAFTRQNDLHLQWGGPNADNAYRHARVAPGCRYLVRGRMHSCSDFSLVTRAGFMHRAVWGTLTETSGRDLGIGPGEEFEVVVEPPDGAVMLTVREYYYDWVEDEPATFTIELVDGDPPAPPPIEQRLVHAVDQVEDSLIYWDDYMRARRAEHTDNVVGPPSKVAKGLDAASYGFTFWDLSPRDALVVESEVPDARYWSIQLYGMAWFELLDTVGRQVSLNHTQAHVDVDGKVRWVVSSRDPGVPNWLDTEGRRNGLCTYRWFWAATRPQPTGVVVPVDAVRDVLPADVPLVTPADRAATIAARRRHLAWRFRV